MRYMTPTRVVLKYEMPLAEVIIDFYDQLKSVTSGYGSFNYELAGYHAEDLVRVFRSAIQRRRPAGWSPRRSPLPVRDAPNPGSPKGTTVHRTA